MNAKYIATALALLLAPAAWGQAQQAGAAPRQSTPPTAPTKVGIINVRQAIISTAEGKQASAELQSQFTPRQTELENMRKQIDDLQNRLRAGQNTLPDDEKARMARQADQLSRQLQRKQEDFQEDIREAENEVISRIGQKMSEVLNRYARENGYMVIFDVSGQNQPVVFAADQADVTADIIRLYDQANPVRATSPQPAQPRPQPAQTRPPQQPPPQKPPQD